MGKPLLMVKIIGSLEWNTGIKRGATAQQVETGVQVSLVQRVVVNIGGQVSRVAISRWETFAASTWSA